MTNSPDEAMYIAWAEHQLSTPVTPVQARSGAHSTVYELKTETTSWYLKIGDNLGPERDRLQWLAGKFPAPQVVAFATIASRDALLMTTVVGTDLAHLAATLSPDEVVARLAAALRAFHAVDAADCPFVAYKPGKTLVHGDACLPNVIFDANGTMSGYIDLGDMGRGDVEVDLSAAVWSLNYNLGPGYGLKFLRAYGMRDATNADVERLWQMYATSPIFER